MKRGIFLCLLFFIIFTILAAAQQDEFSVRFHSFGKNATIDLKNYLGESDFYISSQTDNIIVNIDQEKGIATLRARLGWEGSEVVYFRTNESLGKIEHTEEMTKFMESVPEILFLRRVRDEELTRLFEGTIDPSILEIIKKIKREEIKKLSSEIKENRLKIRINDEIDLKLELGYIPSVGMDFSLGKQKEIEEEEKPEIEKKALKIKISDEIIIAIISVIGIICVYFYIKYSKKKEKERKEIILESTISKDVKRLSLHKLRRLQKDLGRESSEEFIRILREFFSRYFGIGYDFDFQQLIRRVKDSDIRGHTKREISDFLNNVSKKVYYPTEEYTDVYGGGQIQKKDLKKFIRKLKSIIRHL